MNPLRPFPSLQILYRGMGQVETSTRYDEAVRQSASQWNRVVAFVRSARTSGFEFDRTVFDLPIGYWTLSIGNGEPSQPHTARIGNPLSMTFVDDEDTKLYILINACVAQQNHTAPHQNHPQSSNGIRVSREFIGRDSGTPVGSGHITTIPVVGGANDTHSNHHPSIND